MSDSEDTASCFSEEGHKMETVLDQQQLHQPENLSGPLFTCLSCQVAFRNPTDQRTHMKGDLHRYNLKRKVAGLGPVTAQVFAEKLKVAQGQPSGSNAQDQSSKKESGLSCSVCR